MEQKFIAYGERMAKNGTSQGVVVAIDFSSLHQRVCQGAWDPRDPNSDYEFWTPKNFQGDSCRFGKSV